MVETVLVGRSASVGLSTAGRAEASRLRERVASYGITHVQTSPSLRARATAAILAAPAEPEVCPTLDEIDFGDWTGRTFADLRLDAQWREWNTARAGCRPPNGEGMAEAQQRILAHLADVGTRNPSARIAMVTHAELIRAAVLNVRRLPLHEWQRIEIPTASVTPIKLGRDATAPMHLALGGTAA